MSSRYLKQEIAAPPTSEGGRFTSVTWHPENALQMLLTTKSQLAYLFQVTSSLTFLAASGDYLALLSLGDLRRYGKSPQ